MGYFAQDQFSYGILSGGNCLYALLFLKSYGRTLFV